MDTFTPCDAKCRARSFSTSYLPHDGGELDFCAHHTRKFRAGLKALGALIVDRSDEAVCGCEQCSKL